MVDSEPEKETNTPGGFLFLFGFQTRKHIKRGSTGKSLELRLDGNYHLARILLSSAFLWVREPKSNVFWGPNPKNLVDVGRGAKI